MPKSTRWTGRRLRSSAASSLSILGASGAGKTTALNILGGMDAATSGHVVVDGRDVSAATEDDLVEYRRADVGFVFQFYNLVPNLTALENVELASQICPDSLDAAECLRKVGLGERMANFPSQLSGRRAAACVHRPSAGEEPQAPAV